MGSAAVAYVDVTKGHNLMLETQLEQSASDATRPQLMRSRIAEYVDRMCGDLEPKR